MFRKKLADIFSIVNHPRQQSSALKSIIQEEANGFVFIDISLGSKFIIEATNNHISAPSSTLAPSPQHPFVRFPKRCLLHPVRECNLTTERRLVESLNTRDDNTTAVKGRSHKAISFPRLGVVLLVSGTNISGSIRFTGKQRNEFNIESLSSRDLNAIITVATKGRSNSLTGDGCLFFARMFVRRALLNGLLSILKRSAHLTIGLPTGWLLRPAPHKGHLAPTGSIRVPCSKN